MVFAFTPFLLTVLFCGGILSCALAGTFLVVARTDWVVDAIFLDIVEDKLGCFLCGEFLFLFTAYTVFC